MRPFAEHTHVHTLYIVYVFFLKKKKNEKTKTKEHLLMSFAFIKLQQYSHTEGIVETVHLSLSEVDTRSS